jgi:hypothetical protein
MVFCDRDEASTNGMRAYVNGVAISAGVNASGAAGSATNSSNFNLGYTNAVPTGCTDHIAYVAMWKKSTWFAGGAQNSTDYEAIARERAARLFGSYAYKVKGGNPVPTQQRRTTAAFVDTVMSDGNIKLFYVSPYHLRACRRTMIDSNIHGGYLAELAATDEWNVSRDANTINKSAVTVTYGHQAPDDSDKAQAMIGSAINDVHGIWQTRTGLNNNPHWLTAFIKPGAQNYVYFNDSTVTGGKCWFDTVNGTVGTMESNILDARIDGPFVNGWYRCGMQWNVQGGFATIAICPADNDNDLSFLGDGSTVDAYIDLVNLVEADCPTSPIFSDGAVTTRNEDLQLRYEGGSNLGGEDRKKGTIVFNWSTCNYDSGTTLLLHYITDGGSSLDRIRGRTASVTKGFRPETEATGGNGGAGEVGVDILDGNSHRIRHLWKDNSMQGFVDSTGGPIDTTCDMPDDLDRIHFEPNDGVYSNVKIFNDTTNSLTL